MIALFVLFFFYLCFCFCSPGSIVLNYETSIQVERKQIHVWDACLPAVSIPYCAWGNLSLHEVKSVSVSVLE